jgi:hypothetical protein
MLCVDDESAIASLAGLSVNFDAFLPDDPIPELDEPARLPAMPPRLREPPIPPAPDPIVELPELCCPNPLDEPPRPPPGEPDERPKLLPCDDRPVPLDEPMRVDEDRPPMPFIPPEWL